MIDTVGFNERFWMDRRGVPHTDQLHTIERFTRNDCNAIRYEFTVDDPGAYTAPWKGTLQLALGGGPRSCSSTSASRPTTRTS